MSESHQYISDAIAILKQLGFPPKQQQERSALTLLALLDLQPDGKWQDLKAPLMGVTPIMDWMNLNYQKQYAPNSRETVRRQTLHQFVSAGLILYNPDEPNRPVNSGKTVYQIEPSARALLQSFGTDQWESNLEKYLADRDTLVSKYAKERE